MSTTTLEQTPHIAINGKALRALKEALSKEAFIKFLEHEYNKAAGLDKLHWQDFLGHELSYTKEYEKSNEILSQLIEELHKAPPEKIVEYYDLAAVKKTSDGFRFPEDKTELSMEELVKKHCDKLRHRMAINFLEMKNPAAAQKICDELEPDNIGKGLTAPNDSLHYYLAHTSRDNFSSEKIALRN